MWRLSVLLLVATTSAQIPSLGWCPDYQPMADFNMNRFLGNWFEAERYFTVSELGSRCVTTNYGSTPEGRIIVSNEITNSLTGMKRLLEGSLQMVGREGEGRIMVKYSSYPLPYDSEYTILGTDYDSFAVLWSCSGIGPVHTQNTWIYTRDRFPELEVMQNAYAVLEKYKISRTFFVKTNQADCTILPDPAVAPLEVKANEDGDVKAVNVVAEKKEVLVEKVVVPNVPQEKAAVPESTDAFEKPMQVPELIMAESEKKGETEDVKKGEMPEKKESKKSESSQ